jgi:hypothetical protein
MREGPYTYFARDITLKKINIKSLPLLSRRCKV